MTVLLEGGSASLPSVVPLNCIVQVPLLGAGRATFTRI